jgi:hypothetical protein
MNILHQSEDDCTFTHQGKGQTSLRDTIYWTPKVSIEVAEQIPREGKQNRYCISLLSLL